MSPNDDGQNPPQLSEDEIESFLEPVGDVFALSEEELEAHTG